MKPDTVWQMDKIMDCIADTVSVDGCCHGINEGHEGIKMGLHTQINKCKVPQGYVF